MKTNHSILLAAVFAVSVGFISCGTMGDGDTGGSGNSSSDSVSNGGGDSSSSDVSNGDGDSSSSSVSNTQCRDSQNRILYCNWDSGCYALDPMDSEPLGQTCDYYAENCQRYGALYIGASQEGDGIHCSNAGGTLISNASSSSSRQQTSSSSSSSNPACGTQTYNPSTHFCFANSVYELCGGKEYNPTVYYGQCFNGNILRSLIIDDRDGQDYLAVELGTQIWMAENLNYNASGSKCPNNTASNCSTYGRQYDWATAMALATSYNTTVYTASAKHKGICPTGWHIPSYDEWTTLSNYVGANPGTKLKSDNGWNNSGNGTNNYGFSALPGGYVEYGTVYDSYFGIGTRGIWWTTTEYNASNAYNRAMDSDDSNILRFGTSVDDYSMTKRNMLSVRCVKD